MMSIRQELLEEGGPTLWGDFMDELRTLHLGAPQCGDSASVLERLTTAYRRALKQKQYSLD
jgi:hypothetical protein